jgi:metal-sulfur cluster biosynthetic enzyme
MIDPEALRQAIVEQLRQVTDPETGVDVVRMRLIEDLTVSETGKVAYKFRPSSPFCPIVIPLSLAIQQAVANVQGVTEQSIEIVGFALGNELMDWLKQALRDVSTYETNTKRNAEE